MKILIFIGLISLSTFASAKTSASKRENLIEKSIRENKQGNVYTAALLFKRAMQTHKNISRLHSSYAEKLLKDSGSVIFNSLTVAELNKVQTPSFDFLRAVKYYQAQNFKSALKIFKNIPIGHRYYPESLLYKGASRLELDDLVEAKKDFFSCMAIADDMIRNESNGKVENYLNIIKDRCRINIARIFYESFKFQRALKEYEKISKESFLWPNTLLEKAWTNYQLEKFNRTLGLLVTFKSPLLNSYFYPESEILTALSYNQMCLWDDSLVVIDNYYKKYQSQSKLLINILNEHKNSQSFFIDLINNKNHPYYKYSFIKNIRAQVSKEIRFNINLVTINKLKKELSKSPELIQKEIDTIKRDSNELIKAYVFNYVNKIHKLSFELFNINLDIMHEKRDMLYKNNSFVAQRARGDIKNIQREANENFYTFEGPFWADELGDYSFGLKSNCQKVKSSQVVQR